MNHHVEIVKNDFKEVYRQRVYRIRATQDFENAYRNVKKGELGGYVHSLNCLGTNSWVFGNAVLLNYVQLGMNSYVVGDFIYNNIVGNTIQINSDKNMCDHIRTSYISGIKVEGYFPGSIHPVVFGKSLVNSNNPKYSEGDNIIFVGCNTGTISQWKNKYKRVSSGHGYPTTNETEYHNYLKQIEAFYSKPVDNNETKLVKISGLIDSMKHVVTESSKTDLVSLINSLQVSAPVVSKGPQRDKFGRFVKKTP